jgi:hypothetical protein
MAGHPADFCFFKDCDGALDDGYYSTTADSLLPKSASFTTC